MKPYMFLKHRASAATPILDFEVMDSDGEACRHAVELLSQQNEYTLVEVLVEDCVKFALRRTDLEAMVLFEHTQRFVGVGE